MKATIGQLTIAIMMIVIIFGTAAYAINDYAHSVEEKTMLSQYDIEEVSYHGHTFFVLLDRYGNPVQFIEKD